jgi:putative transposase
MSQSFDQIYLHIVFSTKNRNPFLHDPTVRDEIHRGLGGECNKLGCPFIRVAGLADHVHIPCHLVILTVPELCAYIANQEDHHRTESFQDEFRRLLTKYGLGWDECYVWD